MNTPAVFVVFLLVDLAASGFPSPGILSKVPKFELIPKPGSHSPFKFGAYMAPSGSKSATRLSANEKQISDDKKDKTEELKEKLRRLEEDIKRFCKMLERLLEWTNPVKKIINYLGPTNKNRAKHLCGLEPEENEKKNDTKLKFTDEDFQRSNSSELTGEENDILKSWNSLNIEEVPIQTLEIDGTEKNLPIFCSKDSQPHNKICFRFNPKNDSIEPIDSSSDSSIYGFGLIGLVFGATALILFSITLVACIAWIDRDIKECRKPLERTIDIHAEELKPLQSYPNAIPLRWK